MERLILGSMGTTEPGNAVGVLRDIAVAARYGLDARTAIAAISVQHDGAKPEIFALSAQLFCAQLQRLSSSNALRVGALGSVENVHAAAEFLRSRDGVPIVVDPVLRSSRGGALYADPQPLPRDLETLLKLRAIITPNVGEAEFLLHRRISGIDQMKAAAADLHSFGCVAVLIKGGHLPGDPVDVLADEEGVHTFGGSRLPQALRGTGCTLAAALACELAEGRPLREAVARARAYVRERIAYEGRPSGAVQQGPLP